MNLSHKIKYLALVTICTLLPLQLVHATNIGTDVSVSGNLIVTGNSTTTNATTTDLYVSGIASTTNLYSTGLISCNSASNALTWSGGVFGCNTISGGGSVANSKWATSSGSVITPNGGGGILVTSSSTITALTSLTSTSTNATSTNFFATTASTTNLFGAGLVTCNTSGSSALTWSAGQFGCNTISGGTSQWTTSGSNIYYTTGHVSIGTSVPDTYSYSGDSFSPVLTVNGAMSVIGTEESLLTNTSAAGDTTNGNVLAILDSNVGGNSAIRFMRSDKAEMGAVGYENSGIGSEYTNKMFLSSEPAYDPTTGAADSSVHTPLLLNQEDHNGASLQLNDDIEFYPLGIGDGTAKHMSLVSDSSGDGYFNLSATNGSSIPGQSGLSIRGTANQMVVLQLGQSVGDDSDGGSIWGGDDNNGISLRDVANGATGQDDYWDYGDTLADNGGHRFYTGGLLGSQTLKLEIANDGTYLLGPVGIATKSPHASLDVNSTSIIIEQANTPSSSSAACTTGTISWDTSYIYVCVSTNTWKRTSITTW